MLRNAPVVLLGLALSVSAFEASAFSPVDWRAVADEGVILVLTTNEDGTPKETKIWLAVIDGAAYIRTGQTSWFANVQRNPEITLRIAEKDYAVRAEPVTDEALIERVHAKFREKYGWSDWFVGLMPGAGTEIMRVHGR